MARRLKHIHPSNEVEYARHVREKDIVHVMYMIKPGYLPSRVNTRNDRMLQWKQNAVDDGVKDLISAMRRAARLRVSEKNYGTTLRVPQSTRSI